MQWDGTKIGEAGSYSGIPITTYHGDLCVAPSVSSSGLRTIFTKSPAHYFCGSYLNPLRQDDPEKEAFTLGRAAHCLLLGDEPFAEGYIARPEELDGKGDGGRKRLWAWQDEQKKAGRTILTQKQIEAIRGMARALAKHELVRNGILGGQVEQTLIFRDPSGVFLKARPDAIPYDSGDFCDLKTTTSLGDQLDRDVSAYRYDMQAALVALACKATLGFTMQSFTFLFVERTPPYTVDALVLPPEDISDAVDDLSVALRTFHTCLRTGNWFGPSGAQREARWCSIAGWAKLRATNRREFLQHELDALDLDEERTLVQELEETYGERFANPFV